MEIKKDTPPFSKVIWLSLYILWKEKPDQIRHPKTDPKISKKTISPSETEINILLQTNANDSFWS